MVLWSGENRDKTSTHAPVWAFPVTFSVTLSSQIKVSHAHLASFCVQPVVQLFCFMLFGFLRTILWLLKLLLSDNQAQITETISRLGSEKVSW